MVSKALVVATYRQKLTELAKLGVDVIAVVPPEWREGGGLQRLEPSSGDDFELLVSPIRWNGHFHLHHYPKLPGLIRRIRPDLVHLDEEPYNLATYFGTAACRAAIPSLFFTWQNLERRYPPPFSWLEQRVYRQARAAIAGTRSAARVLRQKGFARPISVIPQFGVDPDTFRPLDSPHDAFRVGFLNRLTPGKAPLLALQAFAQLPADAQLEIVGDGPHRPSVEQKIRRLKLDSRVHLRSRVPSSQMPEIISSLDVVILPSVTTPGWKEQFGRILIEAMSAGVPVIGSDSGEIPDVIGDAGLVVPEGDASVLAAALRRLYDDPHLRCDLAHRGRERVLTHYTQAEIARKTVDVYREILSF